MKDEVRGRMARRLTLVALLACAVLALCAAGAQAVIVTAGKTAVSIDPLNPSGGAAPAKTRARSNAKPLAKSNLENHGGPVMTSNTNYTIFWDPAGGASFPAGYQAGINKYFEDVAHDSGGLLNTDSILVQYGAEYNSHFGGTYVDTTPYPANGCSSAPKCLTRAQLEAELQSFVVSHGLPTDLSHAYFLLTPKGVESCTEAAGHECSGGTQHRVYCAFHRFISLGKGSYILYASNPYVTGLQCGDEANKPNGNPSDETISAGLAHEHSEVVTDPLLNAWYDSKKEEVADKCQSTKPEAEFGAPLGKAENGSNYNELINGTKYWYQTMWSNETGGCQQRLLEPPLITKMKPKAGSPAGGTVVTITGTNFTPSATVRFGETPAASVEYVSPTTLVVVSPPGEPGLTHVFVTTAGGTSADVKKDKFKYKNK
jgi:hypothetical protein